MRYFMTLFCALTLAACSGGEGSATASSGGQHTAADSPSGAKVYRVLTEEMYEPYIMRRTGGQVGGFEYELLQAVAKHEQIELQFATAPTLDELMAAIRNGDADVVSSGLTITPERQQIVDFSEPFIETHTVALVKADDKEIGSMADLKGRMTSMQSGSYQVKLAQNWGATLLPEASTWLTVNNVATGKAQAALGDKYVLQYHLGRDNDKTLRMVDDATQEKARLAFGVRKGDAELLAKLNRGLAAIRANGTYDQIYARWFGAAVAASAVQP